MLSNLRDRIKERWENASQEDKRKIVLSVVILAVIVVGLLGYYVSRSGKSVNPVTSNQSVSEIKIQTDVVSKTQYVEMAKMYDELKKEIEELKKKNEEIESEKKKLEEEAKKSKTVAKVSEPSMPPVPPPPPVASLLPPPPPPPSSTLSSSNVSVSEVKPRPEVVGSIAIVRNEVVKRDEVKLDNATGAQATTTTTQAGGVKKKYYLTASFMEATLLSGLDAPAMSKGEGHPVPCLFRIKTPAVLPNKVKANLKGCFVIGEGLGNLASERADIRLVSISCIDKQGRAIIDEKIKGFVVDSDGKIGLRGRVVSKMGSVLARSFLAGIVGGLGNIFGGAYGGLGSPIIVTPEYGKDVSIGTGALRSGLQALGSGINQASQELMRFYLELAKQSIPVVEILPTRNVTLVITDGVWLNLKDLEVMN